MVDFFIRQNCSRSIFLCIRQDSHASVPCQLNIIVVIYFSLNFHLDIHDFCISHVFGNLTNLDSQVVVVRLCRPCNGICVYISGNVPCTLCMKRDCTWYFLVKCNRNFYRVAYLITRMPLADLCTESAPGISQYCNLFLCKFLFILNHLYLFHGHRSISGTNLHVGDFLGNQIVWQKVLNIFIREHFLPVCQIGRRYSLLFAITHGKLEIWLDSLLCLIFNHNINTFFQALCNLFPVLDVFPFPGVQCGILRIFLPLIFCNTIISSFIGRIILCLPNHLLLLGISWIVHWIIAEPNI